MTQLNIILLLILLQQFEGVLPEHAECPVGCKCDRSKLKCYKHIPRYVPSFSKEVIVHEAVMGEKFNLSDSSWDNVTTLSINPGFSVYHSQPESFRTLQRYEFKELRNLEKLQIACKCLAKIKKKSFSGLDNLKILDLSNNPSLSIDSVVKGLSGTNILPKLSELYLSNTSVLDFNAFLIDKNFFTAVKRKPLKVLDISNTDNAWFQMDIDLLTAFPHLEKLNISNAGLAFQSLMAPFASIDTHPIVTSFENLKILDISYPSVSYQITDSVFGDNMPHGLNHMHLPLHLTELYAKRLISSPGRVYATSNSTHICFGLKPRKKTHKFCYIRGQSDNLKKLDLAENMLECIEASVWKNFPDLRYLDISTNKLGKTFADGRAKAITDILKKLEILILANNGIEMIREDIFQKAERLEFLDLSINNLDKITFNTDGLVSLKKLDLSDNKLIVLDERSLLRLSNLFEDTHSTRNSQFAKNSNKMELILKGNPLQCSCENLPSLQWLMSLNKSYTCMMEGTEYSLDERVILKVKYLCKEMVVVIVFATMFMFMAIATGIMVYTCKKERTRYLLSKKTREGVNIYSTSEAPIPPVFLSFCSEDDQTVVSEILPYLEQGLKKVLKTNDQCVSTGYSEFRPGFCLANEIIRCIELSSVVVLFVTNDFCKKMWCRSEALTAYYESKPIVLLLWENIDLTLMPKHLYVYYAEYVSVHWIEENGTRIMKPGWDEVCEAIVRLFTQKVTKDKFMRSESINSNGSS